MTTTRRVNTLHRYSVLCKNIYNPQYGMRRIMISSPTKKWIKDNWFRLVGTTEYRIVQIDLIQ